MADWKIFTTRIEDKFNTTECNKFSEAMFILIKWTEVNIVNIDRLRSLNVLIAKIQAIHTSDNEAKKADSDTAYGFEAQLLLARGARIMLTANL